MEPNQPKFRLDQHRQEAEANQLQHTSSAQAGRQFESVEAMLRHDRDATQVPEALAERLDASLAQLPPPKPWWKRVLGG